MGFIKHSIAIFALISFTNGVKVNMQGSLSFGKDVLETLTHYMRVHKVPARRSMTFSKENDMLYLTVKSTYLCRNLQFCEGQLEVYLNEYITLLTKSVESVFATIIHQGPKGNDTNTVQHVFDDELRRLLRDVRKLLRTANMRVSDKTEPYVWIDVIKKITAMFQEAAIVLATDRLEDHLLDTTEIKKKLTQKFVIATVVIEEKYESKLCTDYNICSNSYECTKALSTLLGAIENMELEKVKTFIRFLSEALLDTTFYSHVSETTANELQVILNDMAYSDNVPTKEVLHSIQKTVDDRMSFMKTNIHSVGGKDVELVHIILSDMDHFYSKRKMDPFHSFLSDFFDWARLDTKLKNSVHLVLRELGEQLYAVPESLHVKLIHEVRAFLELTVDPEKKE